MLRYRKKLFRTHKVTQPLRYTEKMIEKCVKNLFSPIRVYLCIHGNFFPMKMNYTARICLLIAFTMYTLTTEGYVLYTHYTHLSSKSTARGNTIFVANLFATCLNNILRILFYVKRKKIKEIISKLAKVHSKCNRNSKYLVSFRKKLIVALIGRDVFMMTLTSFRFHFLVKVSRYYYTMGIFPPPDGIYYLLITYSIEFWHLSDCVVTSYFCSVCYVTQKTLQEFSKKIIRDRKAKLDDVHELHIEISDLLADVNDILHPILLTGFLVTLSKVFNDIYSSVFTYKGNLLVITLIISASEFFNIVLMCKFGDTVIRAALLVDRSVRKLPVDWSNPNSLKSISKLNKTFEGFKLLNSITIDCRFIFSILSDLLTYGILIATFTVSATGVKRQ